MANSKASSTDIWMIILTVIIIIIILIIGVIFLVFLGILVFSFLPKFDEITDDISSIDKTIESVGNTVNNIGSTVEQILAALFPLNGNVVKLLSLAIGNIPNVINIILNSQLTVQDIQELIDGLTNIGNIKQEIEDNLACISDNYNSIENTLKDGNIKPPQIADIKEKLGEIRGCIQAIRTIVQNAPTIPAPVKQQILDKLDNLDINTDRVATILKNIGALLLDAQESLLSSNTSATKSSILNNPDTDIFSIFQETMQLINS